MIYTSYYARVKALEKAGITPISVSRGKPKWFHGEAIDSLAPTWDMLKMAPEDYNRRYHEILAKNNPAHVALGLIGDRDVALLCYERDINDCHRKMIGEWLRESGFECEEWEPEKRKKEAARQVSESQLALF